MKPIYWFILLIVFGASTWIILHTAGNEARVSETIDLNWRFSQEDDSTFSQTDYNDTHWETVSLPHDWMIKGEIAKDNPSSMAGGFYPGGIGWYRKQLDLSTYDSKKQFYIVFDGVYMNADVWINGIHLGKHKYGYIGFYYDISEYIHTDTMNVIAVRTDCSILPVDRWYSGAGIYRHVHLIATDPLHFPVQNSRITTIEVEGERVARSEIEVVNHERRSKRFKIKSDLVAPDGSLVSSTILSRTIDGKSSIIIKEDQIIPEPEFWSDKNPALYSLNTFLIHKKKITDNIHTSFGVRDIEFSPDSGFILNKKKVWLKGVCIHHDGGALGAAVPEATWEYRLNSLKELGVNALRLAHNPHAPEVLDLCDKMGFLVIDEMYDKWGMIWERVNADFAFTENYKEDLDYFIRRDQNHPSVIAWSMGNETIEQLENPELGVKWYTELAAIVKELDSTRMVTAGLHPGYPRDGIEIPSSYIHVT
ncbi:MAG: hypothetical protein PF450_01070, partial [Bacteroidales bacterium]|nr:hypothetical protein [Bacteroidales bacterium]